MAKETKKRTLHQLKSNILTLAYELPVHTFWLSDEEIEKIENDATVLSAMSIRKAFVLKKELLIQTKNEAIKEELEKIVSSTFLSQILDTTLQGFSVFELNWYEKDTLYYPKPIERDYRDFTIINDQLYYQITHEVDPLKAIYLTNREKFNAKLGRPLYHTLFWLRRFKAASLEFWVEFLEKFGSPWVVGKTNGDKNLLAEELYSMLGGDVAVIEDEDSIDLTMPNDKGAFRDLVNYIDNQIWQSILGSNLTANVQGGSHAAAKTHKEISEAISLWDQNLLNQAIKELIEKFKELNHLTEEIAFSFIDKNRLNQDLADRDAKVKTLMGDKYQFSKDYLIKNYNIEIEDKKPISAKNFTFSKTIPLDNVDKLISNIDTTPIQEEIYNFLKQTFANANTYEEAYEALQNAFAQMDELELLKSFQNYIATASLLGNAEIGAELEKN